VHRKAMTAPQANPAWEGLFPLRPHRSTTPSRNPPNYPPPTTPLPLPNLPLALSLLLPPQRSRRAVQGFGTKPTPFIPDGTAPGCTHVPRPPTPAAQPTRGPAIREKSWTVLSPACPWMNRRQAPGPY
jgi:hypothetical protein